MRIFLILCLSIAILVSGCKKNDTPITSVTINYKAYPVVQIGTQLWTAKNYDGIFNGVPSPYTDENTVGKFYTVAEVNSLTLPPGWRVPTVEDYVKLFKSQGTVTQDANGDYILGGTGTGHLRTLSDWTVAGDNTSGFSAYSAGYCSGGQVYAHQVQAIFWTSTPSPYPAPYDQQCFVILNGDLNNHGSGSHTPITDAAIVVYSEKSSDSYSIRFVKDN